MNNSSKNSTNSKSTLGGDLEGHLKSRETALRNTVFITAFFALLISLLMLFNYLQLAGNDPVESEVMKAMLERLADDPNNTQLADEIRAFDLMARKAYFTSQWQIQTGAWLLLIAAVVLVFSLRAYFAVTSKIDEPETTIVSQQTARLLSSKWLLGTGSLIIVLALAAAFLSNDHLKNYQAESVQPTTDNIEVVDLTSGAPLVQEIHADSTTMAETTPLTDGQTDETVLGLSGEAVKTMAFPSVSDLKKQHGSFRGTLGHGVSQAKNIPVKWNTETGENIRWKVKIPEKGYSSPVIWGNKLFVTGANAQERWVYCYHTDNGKLLWQQQANNIPGSPASAPKTTDDTGLAAPSVVTDGNQVVAIFGTGDLIAFNMDGQRLWAKNLGVPDNHYGHSSSLISWKEKVFVQFDTNKGGRLIALNMQTGESIWDIKRSSHISWASPILIEVDGKMQLVTSAEPSVAGYDVNTGKELWKVDCMMGEVGPSPGFGNGLVFATNEYATLAAIDPSTGKIVWEDNQYLPEVASPVVSDGLLFIATTYGVLACYDVHTKNMYWEAEFDEGFYSSPLIADGKIYAIDMKGMVHILKVNREKTQIASVATGEKITTSPAFTDGRIYIRGNEHLICIGKP
jgi:outer membrane protein assembly factor BamB